MPPFLFLLLSYLSLDRLSLSSFLTGCKQILLLFLLTLLPRIEFEQKQQQTNKQF